MCSRTTEIELWISENDTSHSARSSFTVKKNVINPCVYKFQAVSSKFEPGVVAVQDPAEDETARTVEQVQKDYQRYRDWTVCFHKLRQSHRKSGKDYSRKKLTNIATFYSKLVSEF
jgi:hypothetical protein